MPRSPGRRGHRSQEHRGPFRFCPARRRAAAGTCRCTRPTVCGLAWRWFMSRSVKKPSMVGATALTAAPKQLSRDDLQPARAAPELPTDTNRWQPGRHGRDRSTTAACEERRRHRRDTNGPGCSTAKECRKLWMRGRHEGERGSKPTCRSSWRKVGWTVSWRSRVPRVETKKLGADGKRLSRSRCAL